MKALHLLRAGLWLLWCLPLLAVAQPAPAPAEEPSGNHAVLEVFVREGCPHCADAEDYLQAFASTRPWLQIRYRKVDEDPAAREALLRVTRQAGYWPPGVPTFVYRERVLVGFTDARQSGPGLAALVDGAVTTADEAGAGGPAAPSTIDAGWLGTLSLADAGLPLFTLAVGLLDGFNPCAMWVLLFLLSLLVHLRDRRRMALIAGTFVIVSGVAYYAFMAAWLNVFLAVGLSRTVQAVLACIALVIAAVNIKDFAAGPRGLTFSIPARAKPGIYARVRQVVQARSLPLALAAVVALAVMVNFIELLCTAGLPAMYTAILSQQALDPLAHYGYLLLYIGGYILDDSIMVGAAVFALGSRKLGERAGRWLKLLSGLVMLALGLVMLMRPDWLA